MHDPGKQRISDTPAVDLTSMVDVVFLLLIFFVVTASFGSMNVQSQNPLATELPGPEQIEFDLDKSPWIEVAVDQFDSFLLWRDIGEPVEAASEQEMRLQLRELLQANAVRKVRITAHGDAQLSNVVTAWDAALANNIPDISVCMTELDF